MDDITESFATECLTKVPTFFEFLQQTAQNVGYCYNKYECWSGASVSDMHSCMHMFTNMNVG